MSLNRLTRKRPASANLESAAEAGGGAEVAPTGQVFATLAQREALSLQRAKFCVQCRRVFADGPRHKNDQPTHPPGATSQL
mmetsp:Transcript_112807/g.218612  ORF Transcript_112807/g.218612 Transcript_112807/m.218612 type:complete len:81 (-) Transcript_112807:522-764(-)